MVDVFSSHSAVVFTPPRNISTAINAIISNLIHIHRPLKSSLATQKSTTFAEFISFLNYHHIFFQTLLDYCHNKIYTVQKKQSIRRQMSQELYQDALDFKIFPFIPAEILIRVVHRSKILYGGNSLSDFVMERGYTPSIAGLYFSPISSDLRDAHITQQSSRALRRVLHENPTNLALVSSSIVQGPKCLLISPQQQIWILVTRLCS